MPVGLVGELYAYTNRTAPAGEVIDMTETQAKLPPLVQVSDKPIVRQMPDAPLATRPVTDIGAIIELAVREGRSADEIEKLVGLFERMQDRQAGAAFYRAVSCFRADCPPIVRRSQNAQFTVTRNGVKCPSLYASLDDIAKTVRKPLADNGLSYTWGTAAIEGNMLTISCILSHVDGHSETSAVTFPIDSPAGSSPQQKYGSTITYAQRYSLIARLGLTSCDDDNDGNEPDKPVELIDQKQIRQLEDLIDSVGANPGKFKAFMGVEWLKELPASEYDRAIRELERKKKK